MSWQYVKLPTFSRRRDYRMRRWRLLRNLEWTREDYQDGRLSRRRWIQLKVHYQMELRDLRMSYLYGKPKR